MVSIPRAGPRLKQHLRYHHKLGDGKEETSKPRSTLHGTKPREALPSAGQRPRSLCQSGFRGDSQTR